MSQIPSVELGVVSRVGRRTNVRNYLHPVQREKHHQIIKGMMRVTDRQEPRGRLTQSFTGSQGSAT